jgi:hypothetical protein
MFTEHLSDLEVSVVSRYGVGVMLPSLEIWRAFMTDEMQEERRRWNEENLAAAEPREPKLRGASARGEKGEYERFEGLAKRLVHVRKEIDGGA